MVYTFICLFDTIGKITKEDKKKSYNKFINEGIQYLKNKDSKKSWKWITRHSNYKKREINDLKLYKPNTKAIELNDDKNLETWSNHFAELCKLPSYDDSSIELKFSNKFRSITDQPILWDELRSTIRSLKNGKASGIDQIPCEVYKLVKDEKTPKRSLAKALLSIINEVFVSKEFPEEWKDCILVPIHKKGDKHNPNNYRGITLINTLLKVLCLVLAARLQSLTTSSDIICREQTGFISQKECVAQTACLMECCQRRRNNNRNTVLCFLDLKKAYDLVPHHLLIEKLAMAGIGKTFVSFIAKMYANTSLKVRVDNKLGKSIEYKRGVRQGCPTSPLLFNIFYNSVLEGIEPLEIDGLDFGLRGLMFADDTVIFAKDRNDMINKLVIVNSWMESNQMEINPTKSAIMEI